MATKDETQKLNPKIDFFKFDLREDKQQTVFAKIFSEKNGDWSAIKSELLRKEGFNPKVINNLEFTHH